MGSAITVAKVGTGIGAGVKEGAKELADVKVAKAATSGAAAGRELAQAAATPVQAASESVGYSAFSAFKRAQGPAGAGQAWHHIVEQTPGNVERFGRQAIHSSNNLVRLPHGAGSVLNPISGFYSSE